MTERTLISSGSRTERVFGYSRAVRVGDHICVSGTTAMGPDGPVGGDDMAEQTGECLRRVELALEQAGAGLDDVVRTRVFVTDIGRWEEVGRVHSERFANALPASTIVEVAKLFAPGLLIEIEVDAIVSSRPG